MKVKKRIENKKNLKIINNTRNLYNNTDDYLLQRRIEREANPSKFWKRKSYWNMSLREHNQDEDFYKINLKAKEVTRKALIKEDRILESDSEQFRMQQNNEVDKMLIDSLKAKIKLLNNLSV